jgi:hypothetical protein
MRRLFYVAVTRAKCDVAFVCNTSSFAKMGFFACLAEAFGFTKDGFATLWNDDRTIRTINGMNVAFERMAPLGAGARKRRRLVDAALEQELATGEILPLSIATPPPIESAEIPVRRDRSAGILLHRVLELADADPLKVVDAAAAELGASPETVTRVRRRLQTIAQSPTFKRIAKAETIGREFPLRGEENWRIDRLVREKGRELVIDYKSGAPSPDHELQVRRYCDAIARMTGRPCAGLIWYIDEASDHAIELR